MRFNPRDFSANFALATALLAPSAALAQYGARPTVPPAVVERLENEIDELRQKLGEQRERIDVLIRRSMTIYDEDKLRERLKAVEDRQKLFEEAFIKKMDEGRVVKKP
jgi:hypothetical protein